MQTGICLYSHLLRMGNYAFLKLMRDCFAAITMRQNSRVFPRKVPGRHGRQYIWRQSTMCRVQIPRKLRGSVMAACQGGAQLAPLAKSGPCAN